MKFKYHLSVCAILKNEGHYLPEWIEYHLLRGVEHFYLYDNNSTDNSNEVLRPYINEGKVELTRWPMHPGQIAAYNHCISLRKNESKWIAFIDGDEFIAPTQSNHTIPEVLSEFEDYNGLAVNWVIFGSNGKKEKLHNELQIEAFTKRSPIDFAVNRQFKSIVNPRRVVESVNPHYFNFLDQKTVVTENREPILEDALSDKVSVKKIRIHHYMTRTEEDLYEKLNRGRAPTSERRNIAILLDHDINQETDTSLEKFSPYVKSRIQNRNCFIAHPLNSSQSENLEEISKFWNLYRNVLKATRKYRAETVLEIGPEKIFSGSSRMGINLANTSKQICHDPDVIPWPYLDQSFENVIALNFLNETHNLELSVTEIMRISKNLTAVVPIEKIDFFEKIISKYPSLKFEFSDIDARTKLLSVENKIRVNSHQAASI